MNGGAARIRQTWKTLSERNSDRQRMRIKHATAWLTFILSFTIYCISTDLSASYWDCPEYILVGSRLEVGHPPGNPTWMLVARMASLLAPAPHLVALTINLTSGLFTALAAMLLYLIALRMLGYIKNENSPICFLARVCGAVTGALAFAWCDTAWFSAVEAEVYAFSIFCTALCVWLMLRWTDVAFSPAGERLLILTAYITGLSLGVHQLNLLCLPTLALIYVFRRNSKSRCRWKAIIACFFSLFLIALVLYGMMPGSVQVAGAFELWAVNTLGLPFHSGVVIYAAITLLVIISAYISDTLGWRISTACLGAAVLWLTGILDLTSNLFWSAVTAVAAGAVAIIWRRRLGNRTGTALWCLGMLWLGYSTYGVILIRGAANPPINESAPTDIFAFKSYLTREQYGSRPILRGRTPYSSVLREEVMHTGSSDPQASYPNPWRDVKDRVYTSAMTGAIPVRSRAMLDSTDIHENKKAVRSASEGKDAYLIDHRKTEYRFAPELDMWLPRITSNDPSDIEAYAPWCGMTPATMDSVMTSVAVDSTGQPVGRYNATTGKREKESRPRPTYLQNFRYLASYQIGYMYLRYLMWNFSGRQNDRHSTGEADNGNFITGIPMADNAMLGPQELLPSSHSTENPGRHVYFLIPFILGLAGLVYQLRSGRCGRRAAAVTGSLFIMTGIAIVFYVNQGPGEPRERDYSYVGSFFAFALWISTGAFAAVMAWRKSRKPWRSSLPILTAAGCLAVPVWMCASNFRDHNRRGSVCPDMAANTLNYLEKDAILFVNGDNYTFPLWYIREVEELRPDVRIVNLAYLGTTWYAMQLMMPDRESAPVPMTAKPADIGCDNFILTLHGASSDSMRTRRATDALQDLYTQKSLYTPRLNADTLLLNAPSQEDPPKIVLKNVASGKRTLGLSQLLVLDIVATNAASPRPRPIYWLNPLRPAQFSGAYPYTVDEGLTRRYPGHKENADSLDSEVFLRNLTGNGLNGRPAFRFGGASLNPIDPTSATILYRLRHSMIRLGLQLIKEGKPRQALTIARKTEVELPGYNMSYKVFTDHYKAYSELTELARIYACAGEALDDPHLRQHALSLLETEIERLGQWRRFYTSLPQWRREVMSPQPKIERGQFYAPVALWIEIGGNMEHLLRMPAMQGVDIDKERREWEKTSSLREVLQATRFPLCDSEMEAVFSRFRDLGGHASDLRPYPETESSPWLYLLPE